MNDYDNLVEACIEKAIREHKDKSDAELEKIAMHNAVAIQTTSDLIESSKMLGELKGCKEIQRWRAEEMERKLLEASSIGRASASWLLGQHDRKKKAVLNLPVATSYHGQLIAAILDEEDDLTAEEIRQWSDELAAMDNKEYKKLLAALVDENILYINNNGNYSLLTLCTSDLFPTDPLLFIEKVCDHYIDFDVQKFLEFLAEKKMPATENEWMEINEPYKERSPYKWDNDNFERAFRAGKNKLQQCVKEGILSMTPVPDTKLNCYYFTMLGEMEGE